MTSAGSAARSLQNCRQGDRPFIKYYREFLLYASRAQLPARQIRQLLLRGISPELQAGRSYFLNEPTDPDDWKTLAKHLDHVDRFRNSAATHSQASLNPRPTAAGNSPLVADQGPRPTVTPPAAASPPRSEVTPSVAVSPPRPEVAPSAAGRGPRPVAIPLTAGPPPGLKIAPSTAGRGFRPVAIPPTAGPPPGLKIAPSAAGRGPHPVAIPPTAGPPPGLKIAPSATGRGPHPTVTTQINPIHRFRTGPESIMQTPSFHPEHPRGEASSAAYLHPTSLQTPPRDPRGLSASGNTIQTSLTPQDSFSPERRDPSQERRDPSQERQSQNRSRD